MSSVLIEQQKSSATKEVRQSMVVSTDELLAFCPKCKTFETLWFTGNELMQTRKFSQKDAQVYHDCGSNEPCRLLPCFLKKK
jgi:hypothetical protein